MTRFLTSRLGDRVAYDIVGSGPGVVFVAGAGPFRAWDPLTTETAELAAADGVTAVVYDRLGRGESPVEGPVHLDREVAALAGLIEAAGGSAVLVGHSSGGSIALHAAAQGLPVDGLMLWEPPIGALQGGSVAFAEEFARRLDAGDREGALAWYMKDMPPEWLEGARRSPIYPQLVAQIVSNRPDAESLAWTETRPLSEVLGGIRVPVEVLYGEETLPVMHAAADLLTAAVPGSIRRELPGANHSWEAPAMAAEIVRFTASAQTR